MAHHKSALKRIRQSRKRRLYNRANKRLVKQAIRAVREAKTYEEAMQLVNKAYSILDKVAARGVIHKNKAANHKSAVAKIAKKLQAAAAN